MFRMMNIHHAICVAALGLMLGIAGCNKVTAENFAKIHPGQPQTEVENLLGTPSASEDSAGIMGKAQKKTWKNGDKSIMVLFVNGQVMDAEKNGF